MENIKLISAIDSARLLGQKVRLTAEREDNGELYALGHVLRYGRAFEVERAVQTLATRYEDSEAQRILLGFVI